MLYLIVYNRKIFIFRISNGYSTALSLMRYFSFRNASNQRLLITILLISSYFIILRSQSCTSIFHVQYSMFTTEIGTCLSYYFRKGAQINPCPSPYVSQHIGRSRWAEHHITDKYPKLYNSALIPILTGVRSAVVVFSWQKFFSNLGRVAKSHVGFVSSFKADGKPPIPKPMCRFRSWHSLIQP